MSDSGEYCPQMSHSQRFSEMAIMSSKKYSCEEQLANRTRRKDKKIIKH